jgi:signal transduction histidine kinase
MTGSMTDRLLDGPAGRTGERRDTDDYNTSRVHHAGTSPHHLKHDPSGDSTKRSGFRRIAEVVLDYLPRGNTLDAEAFRQRHLLMCWILGLHVPALFFFGLYRGYGPAHSALEVAPAAACLLFARLAKHRRLAAFFTTAGLVFCSSVIVHMSGGKIEAHFHFFILIGLIALYQDWVPLGWNVLFVVLSHGVGTVIDANTIYDHASAQNRPWSWAVVHGVSVLAACVGVIIFWKNTEIEQQRSARLTAELSETELAAARREAMQKQSVSELFVNLARRNQSLLDRQLSLIGDLEQRERTPEALSELFQLDHLATRIRRNAESLLVLSGDDPPRRWGRPVALGEVVRAAAAEVEDYGRVEVLVNEHLEVAGRAVADLAHLLAELIENATNFSPPDAEVRVRSHLVPTPGEGATFVLSVEDTGIGMPAGEMEAANQLLADPPEVDLRRSRLGFHVVSRLAKRYGLRVSLANTPGGGITALVTLPHSLVSERRQIEPAPATAPASAASAARRLPEPLPAPAPTETPPVWTAPFGATTGDSSSDPTVWTVPDADTLARMVTPPSATGGFARDGVFPPPMVVDAGTGRDGSGGHTGNGKLVPLHGRRGQGVDEARVVKQAEPNGAPPVPTGGVTADGLVRRVPGAGLAPSLRRNPGGDRPAPPSASPERTGRPAPRDNDRVRSMLSRFQASQRAGRAAAEAPPDPPPPEDEA